MTNLQHLLKVTTAWTSIVYIVCFGGVALFPAVRPLFMRYALHTATSFGENIMTFASFISGLVIWNLVALLSAGLFVVLFNKIKA